MEAARESRADEVEWRRQDVLRLRQRGLVPLAIADALGLSDLTVGRYLAELIRDGELEPLPAFLSTRGREHGGMSP